MERRTVRALLAANLTRDTIDELFKSKGGEYASGFSHRAFTGGRKDWQQLKLGLRLEVLNLTERGGTRDGYPSTREQEFVNNCLRLAVPSLHTWLLMGMRQPLSSRLHVFSFLLRPTQHSNVSMLYSTVHELQFDGAADTAAVDRAARRLVRHLTEQLIDRLTV